MPVHRYVVNIDVVLLPQPSDCIRVGQVLIFHQKVHRPSLVFTAETLIRVCVGMNDKGADRMVVMEWAERLIPDAELLQSCFVVWAVSTEALLHHLLDLGRIEDLVDYIFSYLSHGMLLNNSLKSHNACVRVARVCVP